MTVQEKNIRKTKRKKWIGRRRLFSERQKKQRRMRTRMAFSFLGLFLLFMIVASFAITILMKLGVSIMHLANPWMFLFLLILLCVFLAMVSSYYLVRKVFKPLEQISAASRRVAAGDFSSQLTYQGGFVELEETIRNFNRMVKELGSVEIMRNDFIADVSHEFKTPLSAISGYATFLQDPELTGEERNEYIRKIFFNIDKLNDLTENILRLSKLEHQQFLEDPVTYRLDEQLREAMVLLEPKWSRKNLELDLHLPEVSYTGHPALLFQVWTNLIGNAIKYTDNGGKIAVYLREKPNKIQVIVSDNGIGMSEETQAHIFDKFYQGDTSRKSQGNGLGLPLCREIVKKCSGELHVESTLGIGSVFIVNLNRN
ncbi:MAG: HAMP domain-containing histidine kinase [Lachnospiraceae bacterium]|nr:HAMP domain-containing histidine kinase [Lachnospiraceae bacterium]